MLLLLYGYMYSCVYIIMCVNVPALYGVEISSAVVCCRSSDAGDGEGGDGEDCSHSKEGTATSKPTNGNGSPSGGEDSDDRCRCAANLPLNPNVVMPCVVRFMLKALFSVCTLHCGAYTLTQLTQLLAYVDLGGRHPPYSFLFPLATVALTMNWRGTPLNPVWPHTDTWRRRGVRLGRSQSE